MNKKETEVILQRIEKWYNHLPNLFITDKQNFSAKFGWSKEPTSFSERLKLDYKSKDGFLYITYCGETTFG